MLTAPGHGRATMECSNGDGRPAYCRGLCNADYQQWLKTQPPRAAVIICRHCGDEFPNAARQGPDRKFCSPGCKIEYYNHQRTLRPRPQRTCPCGAPAANRRGRPVCADCRIDDRARPYRLEYSLEYALRQHGLTRADYDRTLAAQGGRCAICRSETPKGPGRWHIDHDHVTGAFRGLLCNNCNRGIGFFADDPEIMKAAARYIIAARKDPALA